MSSKKKLLTTNPLVYIDSCKIYTYGTFQKMYFEKFINKNNKHLIR